MVLTPREQLFVLKVIALDNLTEAYVQAGYKGTRKSARAHAARLVGKGSIAQAIALARQSSLQKAEASADEAMAAISRALRFDPRLLLDERGTLRSMKDWPDAVALVVKSIDPATGKVTFMDKLRAAELIAEAGGRIRKRIDISLTFDHVKYLADKSRDK